jgi:flotillin
MNTQKKNKVNTEIYFGVATTVGLGLIGFTLSRYKTSKSNQWLVRTGLGIKDIQIGKKFFKWPFQNIDVINMSPNSFKFSVNAMSKEKMEFNFPAIFTIGPKNDNESLIRYSRYLLNQDIDQTNDLIRGIIEGETRTMSANLEIEEIFQGRVGFKKDVVENAQNQLDQYGLEIYNANIEELKDSENSNYFRSLSQKILSEAENRAKVEVSEQNKLGDIGAKERQGDTRQKISIIESDTTLVENTRLQEIIKSKADLEKTRAEQDLIINQAKIKAENEALITQMKMEKEVESKRLEMKIERQRANELSNTQVQAEMNLKEAEGNSNAQKINADAQFYIMQKKAEGELFAAEKKAEGELYLKIKEAEGMLVYKLKEAESINAIYQAQAKGLQQVIGSFNGNVQALISYTMMEKNIYEKIADSNAKAIQGLNPKITVWTHDPNQAMNTIQNLSKSIIPMLDTITDQTNYKLPDWMIKKDENN